MKDELIALAKEAGFDEESGEVIVGYYSDDITEKLQRFATLCEQRGAAKEREECAILVEYLDLHSGDRLKNSDPRTTCAASIRARKP